MISQIIILSLFVLIGNPLIVLVLMGLFGYSRYTSFMSGLTVAQISEFSLILIALGIKLGHLSPEIISLVTVVGIITIAGSTYMIMLSDKFYPCLSPYLKIFEKKNAIDKKIKSEEYKYFLFGENRIGYSIMKGFSKMKKDFLVVDYNPEIIKKLSLEGINSIYGDVSDIDF